MSAEAKGGRAARPFLSAAWWERYQVAVYCAALAVGACLGLTVPAVSAPADRMLLPALGFLIFLTFVTVPLTGLIRSFRDWRFLRALLVVNFLVVPLAVWMLTRFVQSPALLAGFLLVLLAPCVDYVMVFSALAGADAQRLLAASPVLTIVQMLMIPAVLWYVIGASSASFQVWPFVETLIVVVLLPLCAAALVQFLGASFAPLRRVTQGLLAGMVPLMGAVLALVVAAHIDDLRGQMSLLLTLIPLYCLFVFIVGACAYLVGRWMLPEARSRRALLFSGITRNSLVVLPLALALPAPHTLAPLVVVTQTMVELVFMVVGIRLVPRLIPARDEAVSD